MQPVHYFALQFIWFLLAWSVITAWFVAPALRKWPPDEALAVWIAPHLFRVLGVGLLVPNLAPGLPREFAISTASGDSLTAALAAGAGRGLDFQSGRLARFARGDDSRNEHSGGELFAGCLVRARTDRAADDRRARTSLSHLAARPRGFKLKLT